MSCGLCEEGFSEDEQDAVREGLYGLIDGALGLHPAHYETLKEAAYKVLRKLDLEVEYP